MIHCVGGRSLYCADGKGGGGCREGEGENVNDKQSERARERDNYYIVNFLLILHFLKI